MIRALYWGPLARLLSRFMPEALVPVILNLWPWLLSVGGLALFVLGERQPVGIGIFAVLTAYFSWQIYAAWSWYRLDQIGEMIAAAAGRWMARVSDIARPPLISPRRRPGTFVAVAAVGAALAGLVLRLAPTTFGTQAGHTALNILAGLLLGFAAFAFAGKFLSTGSYRMLLITAGIGMAGLTDLALAVMPSLFAAKPGGSWSWGVVVGRFAATIVFFAAAVVSDRSVDDAYRTGKAVLRWLLAFFGLLIGATIALQGTLGPAVIVRTLAESSRAGSVAPHPALQAAQVIAVALTSLTAIEFARRARRLADPHYAWLAGAVAVLAVARLEFVGMPSLYTPWLSAGDLLRGAAAIMLALGCFLELRAARRGSARNVALEERRRLARELHDGLAQELAFISNLTQRLERRPGDASAIGQLRAAAERALRDSRATITSLVAPNDAPIEDVIRGTAETLEARFGVPVEVQADAPGVVAPNERIALVRILQEALTNAVRHGSAQLVTVTLAKKDGLTLRISDDGVGFDVDEAVRSGHGFGLVSMRERAEGTGATLTLESRVNQGTLIEVKLQ